MKQFLFALIGIMLCGTAIAQSTHQVSVTSNSFTPTNLVITEGDSVVWTNNQGNHNVNGSTGTFPTNPESFYSGAAAPAGWVYGYRFNTVGVYDYWCDPHAPSMAGTVTVSPAAPDNDDCTNATLLTVGGTCSMLSYTSVEATSEGPEPAPSPGCGFYQGGDVWFKVVVPASGALRIERTNGTLNAQYALYSGTCGNMEVITCAQLDAARTIHRPDLAGQEVYIRVWGYNTPNGGTFDLCVWEPDIPSNNYCSDAINLTVGQTCAMEAFTCVYATADTTSNTPSPGCGFYQGGDVWFTFDMPASGELRIERLNTDGNAQYAVYDGTCGSFSVLDCAQLDGERTLVLPDQAGQTLYLRVWGYNSAEGAEFEICLWDPPIPENDLCANAIALPVGDSCLLSPFSSLYATSDSSGTAQSPGCGFYQGGDVWFTVEMPVTGILHIERQNTSGNAQFALYEGTCGNFSNVIDCAQLSSEMQINNPALAGETVYLRVFGYNSEEGAEFEFCAYDTICNSFEASIQQQGNMLVAYPANLAPYLWLGCSPTPDPLSTAQVYEPTTSGAYRVVVWNSVGCADTTECVSVNVTGIEETLASQVQVYPNPSAGIFEIVLGQYIGAYLQVLNLQGKEILKEKVTANRFVLNMGEFSDGLYSLRITTGTGIIIKKLLLQR